MEEGAKNIKRKVAIVEEKMILIQLKIQLTTNVHTVCPGSSDPPEKIF